MKQNLNNNHPAAALSRGKQGRDGAFGAATKAAALSTNIKARSLATSVAGLLCAAMLVNVPTPASAEPWDSSWSNPYVASGYGDQCTAYSWGRFKVANGDALRFTNAQGKAVYPNAGLMYDYAVEAPAVYRDSVPVRGSLISWTKPNDPGHTAIVERAYSSGSCDISEQNWPTGAGPNNMTLTAASLQSRSSTVNGATSYYSLRGFVNPNRPSAIGTLYTNKTATVVQAQFALMDEDRRQVALLSAIANGGQIVPGTTLSGTVPSNVVVTANFGNTSQLQRGRTYTLYVWATDFRGLRSSKAVTFTW